MRTAVDLKLFDKLSQLAEGATATQLASETGADEVLVARILRHLAAMHVVAETSGSRFVPTTLSKALADGAYSNGVTYANDICVPAFRAIPGHLEKTKYQNPTNAIDGPFQAAHNCIGTHFFPYLEAHPPYLQVFGNWLGSYRGAKASWTDKNSFFPVAEKLGGDASSDVLIVDVGGGFGQDMQALLRNHPELKEKGKVILQDKSEVAATLDTAALGAQGIDATAHDFFTLQPVHGAKVYHLHSILHDWPDDECVKILEMLKPALKRGQSRILINELIVPNEGASWPVTTMDWLMMALGSVKERTEGEFRALAQRAGLKVESVWYGPAGSEGVIEIVLP